jgi:hypothetical protein
MRMTQAQQLQARMRALPRCRARPPRRMARARRRRVARA